MRLIRLAGLSVLCATVTSLGTAGAQDPSSARRFLNQYCVGCHNERAKVGGLELDAIDVENVSANPEVWEKALRKIRTRTMPPAGAMRPTEQAYENMAAYLEASLDRVAASNPNPGRTDTFHRLNRVEYRNVIRDLLALDVDVDSLLPADEGNYGFDNVGVAALSPTLLERYLSAAQRISRMAVG